jgi:hypothetical protein
MSILSAIKQQNSSIDDLAALPQAMIMQMAQKKQISEEMLAPILSRKAEMADAFARQNALKNAGQTPPTVMEQLMAQNAQAEQPQMPEQMPPQMQQPMPQEMPQQMPQDMGLSQLPIPERQYAGGGIIAFADGGMSDEDEDYEDSLEEADYNSMIERAMNAGEDDYTPSFETRQAKGSPQSFANSERSLGIASVHPEQGRAEQSGDMDARLRAVIMGKESGGRRYDKSGNLLTSNKGAQGEMQVMPYTSRDPGFGVKPAQSDDPNELRRVGDEYASAMLRRYRDPKLAMIAYNMGPGATDKWLASGADPRRLPRETQGYISGVNLAQGGEVRHFANEGYVDPMGVYGGDNYDMDRLRIEEIQAAKKRKQEEDRYEFLKQSAPELAAKRPNPTKVIPPTMPPELRNVPIRSNVPTNQELRDFDQATALFEAENMGRNAPVQAQEAPKSRLDEYMERMMAREKAIEAQRGDDKNMALLTAGLGMLGGTSPYAMANIGQGALAGVQNLSESKKQRAAEQAALDKSMLYATRYQGAEELNKQNAAYNRAMKEKQYLLDVAKHGTEQEKIAVNQYNTYIQGKLNSLITKNPLLATDEVAKQQAIANIENEKIAIALRNKAFPGLQMNSPSNVTFTPKQESLLSKYLPK